MAKAPGTIELKGRLLFVPDGKGTEDALELGELVVPIRVDFHRPGGTVRGGGGHAAVTLDVDANDHPGH